MSKKKMVIIFAVISLFLIGSVGAGFYVIWNKLSGMTPPAEAAGNPEAQADALKLPQIGPILDLNTFIVNLADEDMQRFLKTSISLEMNAAEGLDEATTRMPQIKDYIVTLLPTKKSTELLSAEGKQVLRNQLAEGLNRFLTKGKINSLYFTDFVIQ